MFSRLRAFSTPSRGLRRVCSRTCGLALIWVLAGAVPVFGQNNNNNNGFNRAVGGIAIDAHGVLNLPETDAGDQLAQLRRAAQDPVPADLNLPCELRKVSLKHLEVAISSALSSGQRLPDEIRYLAGLQRIRYVFVYPEQQDIVLAGFAEGWKIDPAGNVVGLTTNRPVLLLDDLLVALRSAERAAQGGISCSIDPTAEGLARLQDLVNQITQSNVTEPNPQVIEAIEQQLGPQTITVQGVDPGTHFARVLVAADYRMKRLAMNLDPSPIKKLPSYLQMVKGGRAGLNNMLNRWWLATNYEPLLTSADGLAWELRGPGVKTMTENDYLSATGNLTHTGKANPIAQKWADAMTAHYDELSVKEPIFGELRNCMDLAVISALLVKENLLGKAGLGMSLLLNDQELTVDEYLAPRQVDSKASFVRRNGSWVISASGGVMLHSWGVADQKETSSELAQVREAQASPRDQQWWWN